MKERIEKDLDEFLATHPGVKKEDVPSDLLTGVRLGLDPHISPEAAEVQVKAVAEHSGLSEETVRERCKGEYRRKSAWHLRRSACQCFEMQPWNCRKDGIDLNGRRKTEFGSAFKKITI